LTAFLAVCVAFSLGLDAAAIFSPDRARPKVRTVLIVVLVLCWVALALALFSIAGRTASIVTPRALTADRLQTAGRDAVVVLASLGGSVFLATLLGIWSLRASRKRKKPKPGHMERFR
jgi:O-antigen/teichoic acid export membrane protein